MNNKLIVCKACSKEIAKSARTCPHCGAKNKTKHPIFIGIIAFVVLISIVSSMGSSNEPKTADSTATSQTKTTLDNRNEEKTEFSVGETAELKGVCVKFVNVTESTGSDFNKPTDGNVFVLCEFEISNNSDKEITVSSIMSFDAYCDDYTCTFSLAALMEKGSKNQLDGTVAVGKKFNGIIGYEVPADWEELEVRFTPDFWNGQDIVFIASK